MKKQDQVSPQQSIERTAKLLQHLAATTAPMSVTEISNFLGISRSTAYAMLDVLTQYNLLARDKITKKYFLGYQMFVFGGISRYRYREILPCDDYLCSIMNQLSLDIKELSVATLESDYQIVYVLSKTLSNRVDGSYNTFFNWHQRVRPSFCTANGKMLLSELSEAEQKIALEAQELKQYTAFTVTDPETILKEIKTAGKQGYCVDIEGYSNFEANIASLIRNPTGKAIAAVNLSAPKLIYQNRANDYIQLAIALGNELSAIVGYRSTLS